MKAIKSYDETRGVSFSTFANLCIKRQIITAIKTSISNRNQKLNSSILGDKKVNLDDLAQYTKPSIKFFSPEDILLGKELIKLLNNYLSENLTDLETKVFFYMCRQYKYKYKYNEIATILNKPSKKIDNVIQRIRKKVLAYLEQYGKK